MRRGCVFNMFALCGYEPPLQPKHRKAGRRVLKRMVVFICLLWQKHVLSKQLMLSAVDTRTKQISEVRLVGSMVQLQKIFLQDSICMPMVVHYTTVTSPLHYIESIEPNFTCSNGQPMSSHQPLS
ncbi:hypothetical protein V6N11_001068 [Hibiscus sabdariffa]|uniref:Uncharacterized protein n=1 Tax=Hibiscus sabdariffa TaxID=183260 RepID=A0ABR2RZC6_9ROSI